MLSKFGFCFLREYEKKPATTPVLKSPESVESLPKNGIIIETLLKESKNVTDFLIGKRSFKQDSVKKNEQPADPKPGKAIEAKKLPENDKNISSSTSRQQSKENFQLNANSFSESVWDKIMKNSDLESTSTTELVTSLRQGIPAEMRPRIWEFLTSTSRSKKLLYAEGTYSKFSATNCPCESWIKNDIGRTFASNPFFSDKTGEGEQKLFRILRAYANLDTEVGYTQGMNYIAGGLLITLNPENYKNMDSRSFLKYSEDYEEKVFWIFVHIMYDKNWRSVFKPGTPKVIEMSKYFEKMLSNQIPEVLEKIKATDLTTGFLFNEMFITLLLMNCPLEIGQRIIDVFLAEGEKIIFEVLIRALSLSKDKILKLKDDEQLNTFIRKQMFNELLQKYNNNLQILFPDVE